LRRKEPQVREGNLATAEGVSYLETKNLLLLQYCMHLMFYLMLKSEGKPVRHHPVISRLVEIRAYMEKIRPIDKKLHYQIEKLLTSHRAIQARFTLHSSDLSLSMIGLFVISCQQAQAPGNDTSKPSKYAVYARACL